MNHSCFVGLVVVAFFGPGCASVGSVQRAETLGQGNYQVAVEPGVGLTSFGVGGLGSVRASGTSTIVVPHVDASFRYGITDRVDVGLRAGFSGGELMGKVLLTQPAQRGFIASLAPMVGTTGSSTVTALPLLLGYGFGEHEVTLGLRAQLTFVPNTRTWTFAPGASLGVSARVAPWLTLVPEFAFAVPVADWREGGDAQQMLGNTLSPQFKLGIQFGPPQRR